MPRLILLGLAAAIVLTGCARFKINDLKTSVILSLPVTNNPYQAHADQLLVSVKEGALYDLPARPGIWESRLILSLPDRNLAVEFNEGNPSPERIFAPENTAPGAPYSNTKIKITRVPSGRIGLALPADGGTVIQIYSVPNEKKSEENEPEHRMPAILVPEMMQQPPSELIFISASDEQQKKLLADAEGSTRFHRVMQILPGENDLLYVIHASPEHRPVINIYQEFQLQSILEVPESLFASKESSIELEALLPHRGKSEVLASLVSRRKNSFEPAERILYSLRPDAEPVEVYRYDEKEDLPIWGRENGGFLLAHDEDGKALLLKIFGKSGDYQSNDRLHYEGLREAWQDTFFNGEDRIFSVRLVRGIYEIIEWK